MKKHATILYILMLFVLFITGCTEQESNISVAEKTYTYLGEPLSELDNICAFTITINNDGTYSYYESPISSYIGSGKWSVSQNILKLSDDTNLDITNYFLIDGDDLIFIEENSTNFTYVKVKDGERFHSASTAKDN